MAAGPAAANPRGGAVVGGSATIAEPAPGTLEIRQGTDKAIIEWKDFSVGEREHTRFVQPSAGAIALNRVVGGNPSEILGRLSANGQVWIVNPNGIVFGRNAQVDVSGLVATTHDIRNDDFLAGRHRFEGAADGTATVENLGAITAGDAGLVALVAPGVANKGTITARLGEVHLASGRKFVVDLYGDQRINLATDAPVAVRPKDRNGKPVDALVTNEGRVFADGGRVRMSAAAAKGIVDRVVDMTGIVQARTVEQRDGEIVLSGGDAGTVRVSGTLDATGATPGARGGTVAVTGERVEVASGARIDVSGRAGGGEALIGGDYLGGRATPAQLAGFGIRPARKPVPPAGTTLVAAGAVIAADATEAGKGGKAIVWSDGHTGFAGSISAKGGVRGGDGGFVEVSGRQGLGFHGLASVEAPRGLAGNIFLDPGTLTIADSTGSEDGNLPTVTAGSAETVSVAAIEAITSGTVTLTAPDGITVADLSSGDGQVNLSPNVSLMLTTNNGTISFANPANAIIAQGTGSITLEAGYDSVTNYNGKLQSIGVLQTDTGSIILRGADGVALSGTLTTSGGAIGIDADGDQAGGGSFSTSVPIATNGGNLSVKAGSGGIALNGNVTLGTGTVAFSTTSGFTGTYTLGGQLSLSGNVTLTQPLTLNSGAGISTTGTISFTDTVTVASGANLVLTANGFSSTNSIDGQAGTITLKPQDTTLTTRLSGTAGGGELDLTGILAKLGNFTLVSYDNAAGMGGVAIGAGLSYALPLSVTTGGGITASGAISVGAGQALTLGSPTSVTVNGTLTAPGGITVTADTLALNGGTNSLVSSGPVTIQPYTTGKNIAVAGTDPGGALWLSSTILDTVKSTASSLTIGRSDGTGTITVQAPYSFATDTTLRMPGTGSGGIAIDGALSVGSRTLTLESAGPVTQTAAITAGGLELLGTGGTHTLTNAANSVTTLAGNTGSVTFTNNGGFTVGTANSVGLKVSDALTLHAVGGDLTVSQSVEKTGTANGTAALRADGSVIVSGGADIQLATGAAGTLAVTVNPDRDGDGQGAASLGSGTLVSSNGGTIQIGGGSAVDGQGRLTGAARGLTGRVNGIQLDGATLNAGGGDIVLTGIGADAATSAGVDLSGGTTVQTAGSGAIAITGTSGTGAFTDLRGVNLGDSADSSTQSIVAVSGAVSLTGTAAAAATGANAVGLRFQSGSVSSQGGAVTLAGAALGGTSGAHGIALNGRSNTKSLTTTTGAISLTGVGGGTSGSNFGILQYDNFMIGSTSGAIGLTATAGFGSVDYGNDGSGTNNRIGNATSGTVTLDADTLALDGVAINTTGLVAIRPRTAGRGVDLGSTTDAAASLELSDAELDRITAGTLRIGTSTTGAVTVSQSVGPALATTLSLASGGAVGQSTGATVTATNLAVSAVGAVTLDQANVLGTAAVASSGAGNAVALRLSTGGAIGTVDGVTGVTANGASVGLAADSGQALTIGAAVTSGSGAVTLSADRLAVNAAVDAGTATMTVQGATAGRALDLGSTTDAAAALELSDTELDRLTAGTLRVGSTDAGSITISQAVSPANASTLSLIGGQGVAQSGAGAITATSLRVSAGGAVALGTNSNSVTTLAMAGSALSFRGDSGFAVGTVDGVSGLVAGTGTVTLSSTGSVTQTQAITAGGLELLGTGGAYVLSNAGNAVSTLAGSTGTVTYADSGSLSVGTVNTAGLTTTGALSLTADRMALDAAVDAGTATVTLQAVTSGRAIDLGSTTDTAAALELSGTELGRITAGTLRIGATDAGAITVSQAVAPTNATTLSLIGGQGVAQSGTGAIIATNLRVSAGGAVALGTNSNSVGTLAMAGSGLSFRGDGGFAIGTVDGVSGLAAGTGDVTLSSTGTVTQTQAITAAGLALLGTGGAYVLSNAGNAVSTLAGSTGTVTYTDTDGFVIGTVGSTAGLTVDASTLTLTAGGAITQTAALGNVGRLVLSAGGAIDLDESGVENTVTALGTVTRGGAFSLYDSAGGLSLDGAVGGHASGASIRTAGALTVTANGTVAATGSGEIVLAATGGDFVNNRGADAVSLGTGRWLIYAATRSGSTEGSLSGTREYTRSYAGNAPSSVSRTGNVFLYGNTPIITVRADDAARVYGDANPAFSASYSGVLSGDSAALAYTGAPDLTSVAASANAGTHTIAAGSGSLTSPTGYGFSFETGTLTITRAPLTVTATAQTKIYGDSDPTLGYGVSGLKLSDTAGSVLSGSLTRTAGETVGSYAVGQGGLAANGNYTLSFTGNTLSVTPAALSITASDATRVYGQQNPTLGGTVSGLRNGDTAAGLGLSYATTATAGSDAGTYRIGPVVGTLSNYSVTLTPGTLTVTRAPLTVTALDATRDFGAGNPAFTARYDGFVLGQGAEVLGGTLGFATAAGTESVAGAYTVTPYGLVSGNYAVTYAPGTLTVSPIVTIPIVTTPIVTTPIVTTTAVTTVLDQVTNPVVTPPAVPPAVVPSTTADVVPATATPTAAPRGDTPAVMLAKLATGGASAIDAAAKGADAAVSAASAAITVAGRTLTFSASAVAAHQAGQSLNLPSPALLSSPQVREAAAYLLSAAGSGGMGKAMGTLSTLSIAEQKAAFQSVATAEMINGLLTSDDPTARAVGGLLQEAVSGGSAGYADVKSAVQAGGVPPAMMKTYLALYQHVQREQQTETLGGAVQSLVADPAAADLFGRAGSGGPPRIVTLTAPRDTSSGHKVVEGRIDQSARIREARVNGRWVFVDDQGNFSANIAVEPGQNDVVLTVTDESGATIEKRIAVEASRATAPQTDAPPAGRKIALMIATDAYQSPLIPPLKTPDADVAAVGEALNERLGYETRILKNPTKADIVNTMRALGTEIGEQDQVLLYYAGHGYEVAETGTGYWLPADADAGDPKNWVSNNDVARFLNRMPAKQILVVSDSCYSGAFTREQKVESAAAAQTPDQLRDRRSVMAMSSGGDEPVADGEVNSPFAAALVSRVRQMPRDSGGYGLFTQVRDDVTAEVPQTPQYGVIKAAGYDEGGDYLLGVKPPQRSAGIR